MIARHIITVLAFTAGLGTAAFAQDMTPQQQADARAKVQTGVALANIARAEKDGDAMLVAARLLASAGAVAETGGAMTDGKPAMMEVAKMVEEAKAMGADATKADKVEVSREVTPVGYWINTCDSSGYCAWAWLD